MRLLSKSKAKVRIALDPAGKEVSSEELADIVRRYQSLDFLVGGPDGLSNEALQSSDVALSLSRLTFTRELAELILVEQIYRALTILESHPYHK